MIGQTLGVVQSILGPPKKERKTLVGKFLQKVTTGSNLSGGSTPAPAIQNRPLASGSIAFGSEQRNRNLLNVVALAVVALLGYRFLGRGKKRRR
jgi:hypothetical protein